LSVEVLVLVPQGAVPDDTMIEGCRVVRWRSGSDVVRELNRAVAGGLGGVVLVSDGLPPDQVPTITETVRMCRVPVVEVRSAQWDGLSRLDIAAAGKGMVSGFGMEGAWAAARALRVRETPESHR
jgi:hypothetical protein